MKKLLSLQKRAIRLVFKAHHLSHTQDMFNKFKIVNVRCMSNFKLLQGYKLETNKKILPSEITGEVEKKNTLHSTHAIPNHGKLRNTARPVVAKCWRTHYGPC